MRTASISDVPAMADRLYQGTGQAALLVVLVVSPWVFGGVDAWFQALVFPALLISLACWLCSAKTSDLQDKLPLALIPLGLALALPAWQLAPWSARLRQKLSPQTVAIERQLADPHVAEPSTMRRDLPVEPRALTTADKGDNALVSMGTLSVYPAATRRRWALLSMGVIAFATGWRFFRRQAALGVFLGLMALNGAALAFFGLAQSLSWNGLLYWRVPLLFGGLPFGPFVNRNSGAGFLNLCLGCALGWMVWCWSRERYRIATLDEMLAADTEMPSLKKPRRSLWDELCDLLGSLTAGNLALLCIVVCLVAGVFSSLSRGGIAALLGGSVLTVAVVRYGAGYTPRFSIVRLGALAGGVAAILLFVGWLGFGERLEKRLQTVLTFDPSQEGRLDIWNVAWKTGCQYWQFGSGLGTFRWAHQPNLKNYVRSYHEYAENQYLETFVEGGVAGLLLLASVLGAVGIALWTLIRRCRDTENLPIVVAGVFALTTQLFQGTVDFGLYLPSNLLLLAVLCGALCGRAIAVSRSASVVWLERALVMPGSRVLMRPMLIGLIVLGLGGWWELRSAAAVENAINASRWRDLHSDISNERVERAIESLSAALCNRWDDGEGQLHLAQLWMGWSRLRLVEQLRGGPNMPTELGQLWALTDPGRLHGRAIEIAQAGDEAGLSALRADPVVMLGLQPAWKHLSAAGEACPLLSQVYLRKALLAFVAGDPLADVRYLAQMEYVAPVDAELIKLAGLMDLDAGRTLEARARLRRCWELYPPASYDIIKVLLPRLSLATIIEEVLPRGPTVAIEVVQNNFRGPEVGAERERLLEHAERQLARATNISAAQNEHFQGQIAALRGQLPDAIEHFEQSLMLEPQQTDWRYELTLILERSGRLDEALEQARRCLFWNPDNAAAAAVLRRLQQPTPLPK